MVGPNRTKSRTYRRVYVKTPGGRTTLHYRKRKPSHAQCGSCGSILKGVLRERPVGMRVSKSQKRPSRPFGGVLCSACMRTMIAAKVMGA